MGIFRSLSGEMRVELTSADIPGSLAAAGRQNIKIFQTELMDEVTVRFTIFRKDFQNLKFQAVKRGEKLTELKKQGLHWYLRGMLCRPVLLSGIAALFIIAMVLPGKILFISVEGNDRIPHRKILEAAAESGIAFYADRREVRSERMKNALLSALPELQWAGVNTYGCRAVITVRERSDVSTQDSKYGVSHVVAARDGIIISSTVTRGNGLCSVGQAVQKGDILISGYTDCGITITATRAEGEILAATHRDLTVKTPLECTIRCNRRDSEVRYSLIFGKKRINFYKGSGISDSSCVKMYSEYVLTLPGGFFLPVKLVKETVADWDLIESRSHDAANVLQDFAGEYLKSRMIAGTIQNAEERISQMPGVCFLSGAYDCTEFIGIQQEEKIGDNNGKTDGTDCERGSGG